ncbi:MAG: SRPBCC family protein [Acidobacteriia bacterium]|nr:SRPBCC family protein [Terriglobia bacterium]
MFTIAAIVVVILIAGVLGLAASKPDTFQVERATSIQAPPEKIFPFINDFHGWTSWSPWEKIDPAMKRTYGGAEKGKGAVYEWEGNNKVGKGRMEITEANPPGKVTIKLDFIKPFEGHNIAEFTMQPKGNATDVTWAMHGPNRFISKVFHVFMNMDNMIGKQFAQGLANLKGIAEK